MHSSTQRKTLITLFVLYFMFLPVSLFSEIMERPVKWAQPMTGTTLKNFYKLDGRVYRSAQPDDEEIEELATYGIKEILNLRHYHKDKVGNTGIIPHQIKIDAGSINNIQVIEALRIIKNSKGPVLIHCWHGSDRTGTVSAMYRIVFQGWSREDALTELKHGGYGYHKIYKSIPQYILNVDVGKIRSEVFK
jgi:tyrosine-protein phosphatase SIW14